MIKTNKSVSLISIFLGFLPYFFAVIVADIYGGSGITNLYFIVILILCFSSIPRIFSQRLIPIELILYLILIIVVEYLNGQRSVYYFEGLLQLASLVVLVAYLHTDRRLKYFTYGLATSTALSCLYFCAFATNSELNLGDSELRHSLPFFYISSAGLMTALGYFLGLVNYFKKKNIVWIVLCVICFLTCLYTLSKNALLAMFAISILYLWIIKVIRINIKTFVICAVVLFLLALGGKALSPVMELLLESVDTTGNDEMINVSGRGGIWLFCIETIQEKPWMGHGYYTASELLMFKLNENISQAHNGILHALLSTGWVGVILLSVYIIRVFLSVKNKVSYILGHSHLSWMLCMLMYFAVRSITEASFAQCGSLDAFWFFSLSLIMMEATKKEKSLSQTK